MNKKYFRMVMMLNKLMMVLVSDFIMMMVSLLGSFQEFHNPVRGEGLNKDAYNAGQTK